MSSEFQTNARAFEEVSERIAHLSPAKRALLELKLKKAMGENPGKETILKKKERETAPLSFTQQRLWFLDQYEPNSPYYNIPMAWRLKGTLNIDAISQALNAIIERHESLRTFFPKTDGEPVQIIVQKLTVNLPLADLSDHEYEERETAVQRLCTEEAWHPFDLSQGPLIRCSLLRLDSQEHVLRVTMHHIISDGWSMDVLDRELWALYEAFSHGRPSPLPALPIQYADFSEWQRQWFQGEVLEKQLDYWKARLSGAPPVLELPTDRPYPVVQRFQGACHTEILPAHLLKDLKTLSREMGVTLFMTLLAAFQLLLHRYTGQEDIVVGSPIAGRNRVEVENLIGFFVNTLVLRTDFFGNPTFKELLRRVREVALGAFEHQDLPFEKLVEELKPERLPSHNPLIQVVFALQNMPQTSYRLSELTIIRERVDSGSTKFDITFFATETDKGLVLSWEYNTDLFDRTTIERMLKQFKTLLEGIVVDPNQRIGELPLLTEDDQHQLLVSWNLTHTAYPRDECIHQVFEEEAAKAPDNVAVVMEGRQLTYGELNAKANQLAHYLQRMGVGPEAMVGLCLDRSMEVIIGMLAILKAGGAYVPLDPSYPKQRLLFMLKDTQINVFLTQKRLLSHLPKYEGHILCLDSSRDILAKESNKNLSQPVAADNLAYVMYTSGSTGRPKGVSIIHRGVVRLVKQTNYINVTENDVLLHFAPISFDASTFEIWGALLNGAQLVLFPGQQAALHELGDIIGHHSVTILWLTAGLFHEMVEHHIEGLRPLKYLLAGGDVLSPRHVRKVLTSLKGCRLINGYGPTENTTFTCCHIMTPQDQLEGTVPIGRPISNTQVYILDNHMQPVPIGVPGELYIGGDGLARGYHNRSELTTEKFISNPFSKISGISLYKTGDLTRYLPDGNIEFLGRIDNQVKLRGFRIELNEIETVLKLNSAVHDAAVLMREDKPGDKAIVAYVVLRQQGKEGINGLRSFIQSEMPEYMVPSAFVSLDTLPLTPNGKIDRDALPPPDPSRLGSNEGCVSPRNPLECSLTEIWEKILDIRPIGIRDNFFKIGGHSLLAVRLIAEVQKSTGTKLPVGAIFHAPTVEQLAEVIQREKQLPDLLSTILLQPNGSKFPLFFAHGPIGFERYVDADQPIYFLQTLYSPTVKINDKEFFNYKRVEAIAAMYLEDIRSIQPEGPYFLSGYSMGGMIAFEMACQLLKQGHDVPFLFMLDPTTPNECKISTKHCSSHSEPHSDRLSKRLHIDHHFNELAKLKTNAKISYILERIIGIIKTQTRKLKLFYDKRMCNLYLKIGRPLPFEYKKIYIMKIYKEAIRQYSPGIYPGPVILYQSGRSSVKSDWTHLCSGGIEIYNCSCKHLDLLKEAHIESWAQQLNTCLQRVQESLQTKRS